MEKDQLQELAAMYALGALDGDDLTAVQRLLADSDFLKGEITAFSSVAESLAQSVPVARKPSPELRERILRTVSRPPARNAPADRSEAPAATAGGGLSFMRDAAASGWQTLPVPGALVKLLSLEETRGVAVVLGKLEPGARYPAHRHHGPEDVYMISGDLHIGEEILRAGDFHHAEAGSVHGVNYSEHGCTILVVLTTDDLKAQMQTANEP
jgi:quercetin dioxygenase-like cupin family protein